jgi:arginine exporter protein ArgO
MLAIIFGLLFAVAGIWGIAVWWADFIIFLKGFLPVMIFCGGIISIFVGITAISDALKDKKTAEAEESIDNTKE